MMITEQTDEDHELQLEALEDASQWTLSFWSNYYFQGEEGTSTLVLKYSSCSFRASA